MLPALIALGEKSITPLIGSLQVRDSHSPFVVPFSSREEMVLRVAHTLPAFGPKVVPPMVRALRAKEAGTRCNAIVALREVGRFGKLPEDAIDKVEGLLDDPEKEERRVAIEAMSWIRPSNTKAVAALVKLRKDVTIYTRDLLSILERMGPHDAEARKLLLEHLGETDTNTAREVHRILAAIELPATQALKVAAEADRLAVRQAAREALAAVE